jgi:hypothetical protein
MKILAYITIALNLLNFILVPLFFRKDKGKYNYSNFVSAGLSLIIIIILCGRILGWW